MKESGARDLQCGIAYRPVSQFDPPSSHLLDDRPALALSHLLRLSSSDTRRFSEHSQWETIGNPPTADSALIRPTERLIMKAGRERFNPIHLC